MNVYTKGLLLYKSKMPNHLCGNYVVMCTQSKKTSREYTNIHLGANDCCRDFLIFQIFLIVILPWICSRKQSLRLRAGGLFWEVILGSRVVTEQ